MNSLIYNIFTNVTTNVVNNMTNNNNINNMTNNINNMDDDMNVTIVEYEEYYIQNFFTPVLLAIGITGIILCCCSRLTNLKIKNKIYKIPQETRNVDNKNDSPPLYNNNELPPLYNTVIFIKDNE
jgi:hypothetical protein